MRYSEDDLLPIPAFQPKHLERESMIEWIGGHFDAEAFNLEELSDLADAAKGMEELWDEDFE